MKNVVCISLFLVLIFSLIALNPAIKCSDLPNMFPQDNLRTWKNTETIHQYYHTDWQNFERTTYLYDTHGSYSIITTYRMYSGTDWTPNMRSTYVYNAENQLQTIDKDTYESGTWSPASRTIYTYVNGLNTRILTQYHGTAGWSDFTQVTMTYNADGKVENQLTQMATENGWVDDLQSIYSYTPTQIMITLQNWIVNSWQLNYRETTTYDGIYPTEILHEEWQNTAWINAWKWIYTYGTPGQISVLNQYNYDPDTGDWLITQHILDTYDENGNRIYGLDQNWDGTNWTNWQQLFFTWSNITANTDPLAGNPALQVSNFPNPFNPSTTISFSIPNNSHVNLSIYNIRGQKVKQLVDEDMQLGQHKISWNGKDIKDKPVGSGMYFVRIDSGNQSRIKKMILLK